MLSALLVVVTMTGIQPPDDIAARAINAIREGRDTEARALIAEAAAAIDAAPPASHWRAWARIGTAYLLLGSVDDARRVFALLHDAAGADQEMRDAALTGLGRAALAAHDPTAAIRYLEQSHAKDARQWLATALMMESRSASDEYVERAFTAAEEARLEQAGDVRPRADIAAALQTGEMVLAFLVGEQHAYAWAFDRTAFVGYPLPPAREVSTAVNRARDYFDANDRDGLQRIAEDLVPALLGPAMDRLPELNRLIFVVDEPMRRLPFADMPLGLGRPSLAEVVAVSTIERGPLTNAALRDAPQHRRAQRQWPLIVMVGMALLIAAAVVSRRARRRSRARS